MVSESFFHYLFLKYCRPAASLQVQDFSGANFQGFNTLADAQDAWDYACANPTAGPSGTPSSRAALPFPTTPIIINKTTRKSSHPPTPTQQGSRPVLQALSLGLSQLTPVASTSKSVPLLTAGLLPTTSNSSKQRLVIKTQRSPAHPRATLSDEDAFWVVTSGAYPGVYLGK
jgi:hypothetical protein